MNQTKHTQDWFPGSEYKDDRATIWDDNAVCIAVFNDGIDGNDAFANRDRALACRKACTGMTDPEMEVAAMRVAESVNDGLRGKIDRLVGLIMGHEERRAVESERIAELRKQRDELLAACEAVALLADSLLDSENLTDHDCPATCPACSSRWSVRECRIMLHNLSGKCQCGKWSFDVRAAIKNSGGGQ